MLKNSREFLEMCLDKIQSVIRLLKAVKAYEHIDEISDLIKLAERIEDGVSKILSCLLYTSPSPRDRG